MNQDLQATMTEMGRSARVAARLLAASSVEQRNDALLQIRAALSERTVVIKVNNTILVQEQSKIIQ